MWRGSRATSMSGIRCSEDRGAPAHEHDTAFALGLACAQLCRLLVPLAELPDITDVERAIGKVACNGPLGQQNGMHLFPVQVKCSEGELAMFETAVWRVREHEAARTNASEKVAQCRQRRRNTGSGADAAGL